LKPLGLLLAAGEGSRLRGVLGGLKLEVKIEGLPLLCYPLAAMALAGISEALIVTRRDRGPRLLETARSCPLAPLVSVTETHRWWAGSAWTLLDALEELGSGVYLVSVADHIYHPGIASRLLGGCSAPFCVAGDSSPRLVALEEATKIRASSGMVEAVGKRLEGWSHVDVGVHLLEWGPWLSGCTAPTLDLNELKNCNASRGLLGLVDVTGLPWIDVDTPRDLETVQGPGRSLVCMIKEALGVGCGGEG
jgi:1L-myo-inositol 1-phosphate cytidylyltransferase